MSLCPAFRSEYLISHLPARRPWLKGRMLISVKGPKAISDAASTPLADATLLGRRRKSKEIPLVSRMIPVNNDSVTVIDASVGSIIKFLPAQNVYELGFSPLGTFIITWQRPSKDENGDAVKNLKVWRVVEEGGSNAEDGEQNVVGRFVQKSQTGWNLQYTYDEHYCARIVTNEVQFYQSHDLRMVWNKLRVEGVADFAVSPGKNHSIAVFVPERKVWPSFCPCYILNADRLKGPTCCR